MEKQTCSLPFAALNRSADVRRAACSQVPAARTWTQTASFAFPLIKQGGDIKAGALTDDAFRSAFQRCYQLARGRDGDATVYVI